MHAFVFISLWLITLAAPALAGEDALPEGPSLLKKQFIDIAQRKDREALDRLWERLREEGQIPFVKADSVLFLYRGPAKTAAFLGDFNGWDIESARVQRVGKSDLWWQKFVFPSDARLDYKIVLDGNQWIFDPENPRRQKGGFGENSELRMPGYVPSPWVDRQEGVPRGELAPASIESQAMGYTIQYQVYTPPGYEALKDLPVLYVTDGHEYADDDMGSLPIVLDNLLAAGKIRPVMAVFIDPRLNGRNLRSEQYVMNEDFVRFVSQELAPKVDAEYRTSRDRIDRGILGTSLGGLNSAWFALKAPETFGKIGIQSPAFHASQGKILSQYLKSPRLDVQIFLSWGTFHDFGEGTLEFRKILDEKGYDYSHLLVHEGHSWGSWRAQMDDVLLCFWPAE